MAQTVDLVVVGGGPAGALLATLVAQKGYNVTLLEKEYFPIYKIGESLLPSIQPFLALVGLEESILKENFVPKRGGTFRWGNEADLFSFYFNNCGGKNSAYQVRRDEFDAQLIQNAQQKGVVVQEGCQVICSVNNEKTGRVEGVIYKDENGERQTINARYVADSSGYQSKLARQVGERIFSAHYQHIALFGYYESGEKLPENAAGNTLFEVFEDGWCWYFPIKDNLFSVGALIEKEKAKKISKIEKSVALNKIIEQTKTVKQLLENAHFATESPYNQCHIRSDFSYCHTRFWQPGLVLVGDAAAFADVLLSSGVHLATHGAILAARSILSYFEGRQEEAACLNEYEIRYKKEYGAFYKMLAAFYNQEKDARTYQQELRFWFSKTNACDTQQIDQEKRAKLLQILLGKRIDNTQAVHEIRQYIQALLTCENPNRLLHFFPETPNIQSQFVSSKCQAIWEPIY